MRCDVITENRGTIRQVVIELQHWFAIMIAALKVGIHHSSWCHNVHYPSLAILEMIERRLAMVGSSDGASKGLCHVHLP